MPYRSRYTGRFIPNNPKKYAGDVEHIIFRSLLERRVMIMLDSDERIIKWNSESLIIPYRSPIDSELHRYFVDFVIETKKPDGTPRIQAVEVKPAKMMAQPIPKNGKITNKFLVELAEYEIIQCKKRAAEAYCADRGWEYIMIDEHDILGLTKNK